MKDSSRRRKTSICPVAWAWIMAAAVCLGPALSGCGPSAEPEPHVDGAPHHQGHGVQLDSTAQDPTAYWRAPGTIWMADELQRIYREARANPRPYFHLNLRRAEVLRPLLDSVRAEEREGYRLRYARELLDGGATEAAIREVEQLIEDAGANPKKMTRETRPLFELLAFAYQRLGEQRNCLEYHGAEVCIMPFRGGGIHQIREGSRRATEVFTDVLRQYPGDFQSRWLFNVAHMTLGQYPERVPKTWRIDGLMSRGVFPEFPNVAVDAGADVNGLSGSVSVADFNNDGFLDVFTTGYGLNEQSRFLVNDGRGAFVDRTAAAGLMGMVSGLNVIHADYDNDGWVDLFVLRGAWLGDNGQHPNSLLRNNGDGTFSDVTVEAGVLSYHPTNSGLWADFNVDGHLDLFIANETRFPWERDDPFYGGGGDLEHPCELYLNDGDGTFTEVAGKVGVDLIAFAKSAGAGDINNDGRPDLYVSVMGDRNRLYLNRSSQGDGPLQFDEVAGRVGMQGPESSFPLWFWDYNNDGWEDLMVFGYGLYQSTDATTDVAREYLGRPTMTAKSVVYRNNGNGTFSDVSQAAGISRSVLFAMGVNFGDIDNDGYPDFYVGTGAPQLLSLVPNRMFINEAGRRFRDVTLDAGVGHLQKGHGIGFGDFDRDGANDIYAQMGGAVEGDVAANVLFHNPVPAPENAWVILNLEGRTANRSAIGARVRAVVTDPQGRRRSIYGTVSTGGSFGSGSLQMEMGLGQTERIDTLRVIWPNRAQTVQTFTDLPVRRHIRIVEGAQPELLDRPAVPWRKRSR